MPTWISDGGKWSPAKEKLALKNHSKESFKYKEQEIKPEEEFIYDGPDREALRILNKEGVEFLGQDFKRNPEFLQAVRNQGFEAGEKGVEAYLAHIGYDAKKASELVKEKKAKFSAHEVPALVKEIEVMSGGKDTSGAGNSMKGEWKMPNGL